MTKIAQAKEYPVHNPEPKIAMDKRGREILDTEPARTSVRRQKMVSLSDQMRQTVMQMRHEAVQAENDSVDDEKDFDLPDDEPRSPHELFVDTPEYGMFLDDIAAFARDKKEKPAEKPAPTENQKPAEKGKKPPAAPPSPDTEN